MNTVEWIALGVTAAILWLPLIYFLLTPPRKSKVEVTPSPVAVFYNGRGQRIERTLTRQAIFVVDHATRERLGID